MLIKCFIKSRKKSFSLHRRAKNLTCGNTPKIKKGENNNKKTRKISQNKTDIYFCLKNSLNFTQRLTRKLKPKGSRTTTIKKQHIIFFWINKKGGVIPPLPPPSLRLTPIYDDGNPPLKIIIITKIKHH